MQDWELVLFVVGLSTTLWIIIGYLTARLGPWTRLVERYPVSQSVQTTMKARFVSLEYGWLSYGNCLRIDFSDDHMTVSMSWAVLPFHPPFLVPKSAIQDCRHGRFLLIHWIRFRVDDCRFLLWGFWERSAVLEELRCRRVNH
ncbi:MAG TPA: hypothetical protein VFG20_23845 [Planctomycetaceae bacterium]|nr:hypothetical protein [Planctomycetaceae bacterium]